MSRALHIDTYFFVKRENEEEREKSQSQLEVDFSFLSFSSPISDTGAPKLSKFPEKDRERERERETIVDQTFFKIAPCPLASPTPPTPTGPVSAAW
jgi:hypothetical protein